MVLKSNKIDITDRVVGKLKDGEIELYLENEKIGSIHLPQESSTARNDENQIQFQTCRGSTIWNDAWRRFRGVSSYFTYPGSQ